MPDGAIFIFFTYLFFSLPSIFVCLVMLVSFSVAVRFLSFLPRLSNSSLLSARFRFFFFFFTTYFHVSVCVYIYLSYFFLYRSFPVSFSIFSFSVHLPVDMTVCMSVALRFTCILSFTPLRLLTLVVCQSTVESIT